MKGVTEMPDDKTKRDTQMMEGNAHMNILNADLKDIDGYVEEILRLEDERQMRKIILIASESMCPLSVRKALSSNFVNIYAEGYPSYRMIRELKDNTPEFERQLSYLRRYSDRRYYKGVEYVDFIEALAQRRAAMCFATEKISQEEIFVNVQPLSGAAANNAVYEAFVRPGDFVMGMDLTHGGHLTHGSHANRSGKNYKIISYGANIETGEIDYDSVRTLAEKYRPRMIIAGYSAYPRSIDWGRFRDIAHSVDAVLLADISHPAGLVVAGCFPNPLGYADVISFTTHKTLCGPRGAAIITTNEEYSKKIDNAVFPGEQGGPHINSIAAKAVLFKIVRTDEFRELQKKILKNSQFMAKTFKDLGLKIAYNGTDSHMVLIDIRNLKGPDGYSLKGEIASRILDLCGITCNKNTIPGDTNAAHPGALRFGTTWITQRGFGEKEIIKLASIIHKMIISMKPFKYIEAQGEVGRAKVPLEMLDETRKSVQDLLMKTDWNEDCVKSGYPHYYPVSEEKTRLESPILSIHEKANAKIETINNHLIPLYYKSPKEAENWESNATLVDTSDMGLIEITGERSHFFIEEIVTGHSMHLLPNKYMHTFILNSEGNVLDDGLLMRMKTKDENSYRYILKTNPVNTERVVSLLRALSDGYVLFDTSDLYGKIQGPVIIEDLRSSSDKKRRLTSFSLFGEKAADILKKMKINKFEDNGHIAEVMINDYHVNILNMNLRGKSIGFSFYVHPDNAGNLWNTILNAGKAFELTPSGILVREKMRQDIGLPEYKNKQKDGGFALNNPEFVNSFSPSKPYFIGQKALIGQLTVKADKKEFHFEEKESSPMETCLFTEHKKLTNKLVPFAGYSMPVWYTSINEEHKAVREKAGLFDVSHMGVMEIKGNDATRFLDLITTNYVAKLNPGQSQYSYILDQNGNILDDVMVYRRTADKYMMIVNAVNTNKIKAWLNCILSNKYLIDCENPHKELPADVTIRDLKDKDCKEDQIVDIALQGPKSIDILMKLMKDDKERKDLRNLKRNEFFATEIAKKRIILSRTGYTGEEIGYELYLHPDDAIVIWQKILEAGKEFGVVPAGLGARDSTRTEAGLPLYGHELAGTYNITPHEAGYGSFVKFHKAFFIGRSAMISKEAKRDMEIIRFRMLSKGLKIVKGGDPIITKKGDFIGYVTSCVHIEGMQIGLAYVRKKYSEPNSKVGVFILPRDKKSLQEKTKDNLNTGDKVIVHEDAVILSRFPVPEENKSDTPDNE